MRTGCCFHRVDEKIQPYTTFPAIRNEDSVYFFFDSTRLVMRSVPCLWFSHFVPCAFVCVSNPVPKGIFILFCRLTFKQEVLHA